MSDSDWCDMRVTVVLDTTNSLSYQGFFGGGGGGGGARQQHQSVI